MTALPALDTTLDFEQGPIRPPSEAQSLLLRFTRNCPWNKCKFCPVYKRRTFSRRSLEEIKADIDAAAEMRREIIELSQAMGEHGRISAPVVNSVFSNPRLSHAFHNVAAWLYYDTGNVFIQDANNLVMKPEVLAEALNYLRAQMPEAKRVTTYARSSTAAQRTVEELTMLREAGLDRIHIGLETGYDPLLKFMKKGVTAAKQIKGGQNIKAAGMELSEYVMPGLGGKKWSKEHAVATAEVLNQINPDFIRLRTLRVPPRIELYQDLVSGEFEKISDDEVAAEIRLFIQTLDGITSYVASDHIMNLIETVNGQLPLDKEAMLAKLDSYLTLSDRERLIYRLCRRMGRCREPRDVDRMGLRADMEKNIERIERSGQDPDAVISELADSMV
ncbi:MAG: radical SAM protein [Desulfarculaceae bacterium]|nr:radical SAM protein [Desulfarculaceae bacterium]MCF8071788.1 radical SAM protein [Desulfarculaceae bacterium]MCF8101338.1 radical SAM protein [Desulfarculaceae bacterium]